MVVVDAEMRARLDLARELHDRVSPQLTTIIMQLEDVKAASLGSPRITSQVTDVQRSTREVFDNLRDILYGLRSETFEDRPFDTSVRALVRAFEERSGIPSRVVISRACPRSLPARFAVNVRRVIEEALVNVVRHSGANRVTVKLDAPGPEIVVSVRDYGVGVETIDPSRPPGLGLRGMRERATLLGGKLSISSRPGYGTTVELRVPVGQVG
jgi:signal transduction histidine kinase